MPKYEYHRPKTLDDALELVAAREGARCIAGGTELLVRFRKGTAEPPPALVSLRSVEELRRIDVSETIRIGAAVTVAEVAAHEEIRALLPALANAARSLGCVQIRNTATIGGNLANASPCADTAPPLLVYDASLVLRSRAATREVPFSEFTRGPGSTCLASDEILTEIKIKRPGSGLRSEYSRKGRVKMDLAIASLATAFRIEDQILSGVRVAAGAVGEVPLRLLRTEEILEGESLCAGLIGQAADQAAMEVRPISDIRSSAGYRRSLVRVFLSRHLRSCLAGAEREG
ncbi:MAG: xanthine dehydrogenase family protein subunit M [Planctomycetota bacterium]